MNHYGAAWDVEEAVSMPQDPKPSGWGPVGWSLAILLSLYVAIACNFLLELMQVGGNWRRVFTFSLGERLPLFLLASGLIWCLLLLLWAASGRLRVAVTALSALAIIVGYANYKKIAVRMEPLYPSDIDFVGETQFLGQMVDRKSLAALLVAVVLWAFILLLIAKLLARRWPKRNLPDRTSVRIRLALGRLLVISVSFGTLVYAADFNQSGNHVRAAYEAGGAHWKFWFQRLNYYSNGFVGGLLYNTSVPAMERPRGYSRDTMVEISQRYASLARAHNAALTTADGRRETSVVLVLSEAFSDPMAVKGVTFREDPIPFTRQLMKHTPSGRMLAQLYGGGTANMEFEALTGMSLAQFSPQMQTPYQMLVPEYTSFPSAVGHARHLGQRTIAVHPYMTSMYKRERTYPILGFQRFVGEDDMPAASKLERSEFVSDESAFDEVHGQLMQVDEPLLVNLVTMQNHYPMGGSYAQPVPVTGMAGEHKENAAGYARGLKYTDSALEKFLSQLEHLEERVAVVFYGDHQPAIWSEAVQSSNGDLAMRTTPFFLWANYGLNDPEIAAYTSPIYFLPLLQQASGAPVSPYYALLLRLYEHFPAMAQGTVLDPDGHKIKRRDWTRKAASVLRDYRLVQYDLSVGNRYSQSLMFPQYRRLAS